MVGMLKIIGIALLGVLLTGCGYNGHYRYPCQDPANWKNAECQPPVCTADGTCPKDLNTNIEEEKTNG